MKVDRQGSAEPLTKELFVKVLNKITNSRYKLIFALSWYTAERPGAILKLKVDWVYAFPASREPRRKLLIPGSSRKDKQTREVPCHPQLAIMLQAHQPPIEGYLFPGERSGHLSYRAYYAAIMRTYGRMGLIGYTPYSTRHGSLSTLAAAGYSTRHIQEISGHRSLSSLQRYIHLDDEQRLAVVSAL